MGLQGVSKVRGPTPLTARQREEHFNQGGAIPHLHHPLQLTPMRTIITSLAKNKPGINLRLMHIAFKGMRRLTRILGKRGMSYRDIRIREALYLDRMAAETADHLLERLRVTGNVRKIAEIQGIKVEGISDAVIEKKLWENSFSKFFKHFQQKYPDAKEIIKTNFNIRRFLSVPTLVHTERGKRWKRIQGIVTRLTKKAVNPEQNLNEAITKIKKRFRKPEQINKKSASRTAAIDLTIASSIYADLTQNYYEKHKPFQNPEERGKFWDYAYSEGMELIYLSMKDDENVLRQILALHKPKPSKRKSP
jgi:hypothetical protein